MAGSTFDLDTRDGAPVVVHRWAPDGDARGVVVLAHGMAEHAARYAHLAEALLGIGVATYAPDHRGHGESVPTPEDLGHFADEGGWALVLDDLHRVALRARAEHPDVPLILMGHSMGSFLCQQYAFTFGDDLDGLVLSGSSGPNPAANVAAVVARAEMHRVGPRGRSGVLHQMMFGIYNRPFAPARTDADWLSRDEEQVDRYIEDERCGFVVTTRFYLDLYAGVRVATRLELLHGGIRTDLPVYVFSGARDPVGGTKGVDRLLAHYARAGLTDVRHRLYPDGRHEMLNEINRDEVIEDLLAWVEDHLEP